jgi:DNA-binding MarR family transcriptional regulator
VLTPALGTRLRALLEAMDADVALALSDLGLRDYRTRYSAYIRAVAAGPRPIRDIAEQFGVTHSAASQTVAQMSRCGLVTLEAGDDARERIVHLTAKARALLPIVDAEWAATSAAAAALDAELPFPLSELLLAAVQALEQRPFRRRIAEAARAQGAASPLAALGVPER